MKKSILILVAFLLVSNVFSQETQKRIALIIGNASYEHGGSLKNPVNDANLMASTLEGLGFEVTKLTNASLKEMQQASIKFTSAIKNYDVALFYYAGHGVQVNGLNYLVPIDANMDTELSTKYEALDISDINYAFSQNNSKMNILILDACRDNPFRSWARGGDRGFKAVGNQSAGTIIAFATREGETASDGSGNNGLFTEKLVKEMIKPQDINSVFKNTRVEVLKTSDNKQCPQEWDMTIGNFYFTETGELQEVVIDPKESTWDNEQIVYTYGNLDIYTENAGYFFLDDEKKGYLNANTHQTLKNVLVGSHFYKLETDNEKITGSITVYENQTANIEIKKISHDLPNKFTDSRDGKTYKTVEIGNQVWFAENLAYKTETGCLAYKNEQINVDLYGYLYNWETAVNVCPDGWHLPLKDDFETLLNNTGGEGKASYNALIPSGNSGFDVLFGGYANLFSSFFGYEDKTFFWTKSPDFADKMWCLEVRDFFEDAKIESDDKDASFSVRCLKD